MGLLRVIHLDRVRRHFEPLHFVQLQLKRQTIFPLRGRPLAPSLHSKTEAAVINLQISVFTARNGLWRDLRDILRDHADIEPVASKKAVSIEVEAVIEMCHTFDTALEP